jgi:hypothetical protein
MKRAIDTAAVLLSGAKRKYIKTAPVDVQFKNHRVPRSLMDCFFPRIGAAMQMIYNCATAAVLFRLSSGNNCRGKAKNRLGVP